jgi:hypothetical protein
LSHPEGLGVNDFIDPNLCSVNYSSFDKAIDIVHRLGKGALMGKRDIKSAFNLCPIHPDDFDLLGIYFDNRFWVQKMLPQGASISCAIFEEFSTFVQWATQTFSHNSNIDHYLDDFFFAGKAYSNDCLTLMSNFEYVCKDMNIPINEEKSEGPSTVLTYLGLEIDSQKMTVRLPSEKIVKAQSLILDAIGSKKIRLKELQSIVGILNFFTKAIPSGRAFNCRLYQAMAHAKRPHHFIRVNNQMREDLNMWLYFLKNFNGITIFSDIDWVTDTDLNPFTDAAGNKSLGCGAYLDGQWLCLRWPDFWGEEILRDITFLELIPIVLSFVTWTGQFKGKKIIVHCDNESLVHIINKKSSKNPKVMFLIRKLVLTLLFNNIQIKAMHIPSAKNEICDAISRFQMSRLFKLLPPEASKTPVKIPVEFQILFNRKCTAW